MLFMQDPTNNVKYSKYSRNRWIEVNKQIKHITILEAPKETQSDLKEGDSDLLSPSSSEFSKVGHLMAWRPEAALWLVGSNKKNCYFGFNITFSGRL